MPQETVSKADWLQWKEDPVTRKFFEMISERREDAIQYLAFGGASTMSKKDITVGAINAYTHILAVSYEEENDGPRPE